MKLSIPNIFKNYFVKKYFENTNLFSIFQIELQTISYNYFQNILKSYFHFLFQNTLKTIVHNTDPDCGRQDWAQDVNSQDRGVSLQDDSKTFVVMTKTKP